MENSLLQNASNFNPSSARQLLALAVGSRHQDKKGGWWDRPLACPAWETQIRLKRTQRKRVLRSSKSGALPPPSFMPYQALAIVRRYFFPNSSSSCKYFAIRSLL